MNRLTMLALAAVAVTGCVNENALPSLTEEGYVTGAVADGSRFAANSRLKKAFAFLQRPDLATLPVGRYEIDGEDVFALVQECALKPVAEMKVEAHRKYIDIQVPLSGPETFGVGRLSEANYALPFDDAKDLGFYDQKLETITVQPGSFVMFVPPHAAHGPCCTTGTPRIIKKVVVKVLK